MCTYAHNIFKSLLTIRVAKPSKVVLTFIQHDHRKIKVSVLHIHKTQ